MDLRFAVNTIQILNIDSVSSTLSKTALFLNTKINGKSYIASDADQELLILISFSETVDLHSIKVHVLSKDVDDDEMSPPKEIDIFALKKLNVDFNDIKSMKPHKSISCKAEKFARGKAQNIKLQSNAKTASKFKKIQPLAIYVKSNQENTDKTYIHSISLKGEINNSLYKSFESINNTSKIRRIERISADTNYAKFEWTLEEKDFELFKKAKHSEVTFISNYHNIGGGVFYFEMTPNGYRDATNNYKNICHVWLRVLSLPDNKQYVVVKYQWRCFADQGKITFFQSKNAALSLGEQKHYSITTDKGIPFPALQDVEDKKLCLQFYVTIKDVSTQQLNDENYIESDTLTQAMIKGTETQIEHATRTIIGSRQIKDILTGTNNIATKPIIKTHSCNHDMEVQKCDYIAEVTDVMQIYDNAMRNGRSIEDTSLAIRANRAFHHLLFEHNKLKDFEFIHSSLGTECNITKCCAFQRIYRNRKDDLTAVNEIIQCLDIIHCYYYHSFDIGYRLTTEEINQCYIEQKDDENEQSLIYAYNHNLKQMQKIIALKKNCVVTDNKRLVKFSQFIFGNPNFIYDGNKQNVEPRHSALKEELLQNDIYQMTPDQYITELRKAANTFSSMANNHPYKNKLPSDDKLAIPLLLCLMIYCNYDNLQREFSKTYRENNDKHDRFYHLAKNISTAVNVHGEEINFEDNIQSFYHGVSEPSLLQDIIGPCFGIQIFSPLSTSSSKEVAINFAVHRGIVIDFGCPNIRHSNRQFKTCYFDVSWLSDFGYEKEKLFVQMKSGIYVNNILDVSSGFEYNTILEALKIIDTSIKQKKDDHSWKKQADLALNLVKDQIAHRLPSAEYKCIQWKTEHSKLTVDSYFKNVKFVFLNVGIQRFKFLTTFFMGDEDEKEKCKINLLPVVFPQVQAIVIKNVKFTFCVFDDILQLFGTANTKTKLKYIILYPCKTNSKQNNFKEVVQNFMKSYGAQFKKIGYCLKTYDNATAIAVSLKSEQLPLPGKEFLGCQLLSIGKGSTVSFYWT